VGDDKRADQQGQVGQVGQVGRVGQVGQAGHGGLTYLTYLTHPTYLTYLTHPTYPASTELSWKSGMYSASNRPAITSPMTTRRTGSTSVTNRSIVVAISSS